MMKKLQSMTPVEGGQWKTEIRSWKSGCLHLIHPDSESVKCQRNEWTHLSWKSHVVFYQYRNVEQYSGVAVGEEEHGSPSELKRIPE